MEATPITPEELADLIGTPLTLDGIMLGEGAPDMVSLGTEDGRSIIIAPCFVCGGDGAHLNIIVAGDSDDSGAA